MFRWYISMLSNVLMTDFHHHVISDYLNGMTYSDVVLEIRVLVSRLLDDKNESLGLGLGLGLEHLVMVSVLKKSLAVFQDFCCIS